MKIDSLVRQKDIPQEDREKTLYFDIEVSPILSWTYNAYEGNSLRIEQDPKIISFAWQWEGDDEVYCMTLADYKGYRPNRFKINDKKIVTDLHEVLSRADVVIGQNSNRFDLTTANARFLYHGLPPIEKKVLIDTLRIAKSHFRLPKYTLDDMLRYVGLIGKTKVKHSDILWDCLDGDLEYWEKMKEYNKQDVIITREFYLKIRGFHHTHPNLSFFTRVPNECPKCHSKKTIKRGRGLVRGGYRRKRQCKDCGGYFSSEIIKLDKVTTY